MGIFTKASDLDYSKITPNLYIGRLPKKSDFDLLRKLNVKLVINMRFERTLNTRKSQVSFRSLWLPSVDTRFTPISDKKLRRGVQAALETMQSGGSVYVNCRFGRHRSVIMAACILIAGGRDADSAIKLIQSMRPVADFEPNYVRRQILSYERVARTGA